MPFLIAYPNMDKSGSNTWESVTNGVVFSLGDEAEKARSIRSFNHTNAGVIDGPFTRRPLSGIRIRNDTPAYIQILGPDGAPRLVFNDLGSVMTNPGIKDEMKVDGQPHSKFWTDWMLTTVTESRQEKIQIQETFAGSLLYAFGQKTRTLSFAGNLVHTADFPWKAQFWENWDKYFRATKLIETASVMSISFEDILITGYPINAVARQSATEPNLVGFQFTFIVKTYTNLTMQNAAAYQVSNAKPRGGDLAVSNTIADAMIFRSEYMRRTKFGMVVPGARGDLGGLGGNLKWGNLMFADQRWRWKEQLGGLLSGGSGFAAGLNANFMFSSHWRYINGAKTAMEVVATYATAIAVNAGRELKRISMESANETQGSGGTAGGWYGVTESLKMAEHFYRVVRNTAKALLGGHGISNMWLTHGEHLLANMGSPNLIYGQLAFLTRSAMSAAIGSLPAPSNSRYANQAAKSGLTMGSNSRSYVWRRMTMAENQVASAAHAAIGPPSNSVSQEVQLPPNSAVDASNIATQKANPNAEIMGDVLQPEPDDKAEGEQEAAEQGAAEQTNGASAAANVDSETEVNDDGTEDE